MMWIPLLLACASSTDSAPVSDSADPTLPEDTGDSADTADSGETGDSADTADTAPPDEDEDGYPASVDCNDADPAVNPGATEVCDDVDDDCDGLTDDDDDSLVGTEVWVDVDGDRYGDPAQSRTVCDTTGYAVSPGDCDDTRADVSPNETERCDGGATDEDCDGLIDGDDDEIDPSTGTAVGDDADGDGVHAAGSTHVLCDVSSYEEDCDDSDPEVYPGAIEACFDGVDNDCDGSETPCAPMGTYTLGTDIGSLVTGSGADDYMGWNVRAAGDVDSDGLADFIAADPVGTTNHGVIYLFGGGLAGVSSSADAMATYGGDGDMFLSPRVHDVDGDGVSDLVASQTDRGSDETLVAWLGPLGTSATAAAADLTVEVTRSTAYFVAGQGADFADLDGDGADEYVAMTDDDALGVLTTPWPASGGALTDVTLDLSGATASISGDTIHGADLDSDGIDDVAYGGVEDGIVAIFSGPDLMSGTSRVAPVATVGPSSATAGWGIDLSVDGDVDGDGHTDLVAGALDWGRSGKVCTWTGPFTTDLDETAALSCVSGGAGVHTGSTVAIVPDLDGNGADEVAVVDAYTTPGGTLGLWFGPPASGSIDSGDLVIETAGTDYLGGTRQLQVVGDVTGDGTPDLVTDCTSCIVGGGFWFFDF